MPKTWAKSFDWIFNQKTTFENNYEKFEQKVNKIEKQHNEKLKETTENIEISKENLKTEQDKILKENNKVQTERSKLKHSISEIKNEHRDNSERQEVLEAKLMQAEKSIVKNKALTKGVSKMIEHEKTVVTELNQIKMGAKNSIKKFSSFI